MSVVVERNGPVLEVTIDRPKANAIDAATSQEMGAAFEEFRDDPALRVAILTGAGDRFFSAGWDLKAAAEGEDYESDYGPGGFGGFPELPNLNKPVIAAVNGLAAGGGFELVSGSRLCRCFRRCSVFLRRGCRRDHPRFGHASATEDAGPGPGQGTDSDREKGVRGGVGGLGPCQRDLFSGFGHGQGQGVGWSFGLGCPFGRSGRSRDRSTHTPSISVGRLLLAALRFDFCLSGNARF